MANYINSYDNKKIYQYLKDIGYGKVLFVFQHGLGDLMLFLPIVEALEKEFPNVVFKIGYDEKRNFHFLGRRSYPLSSNLVFRDLLKNFSYVFHISYPEPTHQNSGYPIKPYLCNKMEIGLPNFVWKQYRFPVELKNENSNLVGLHFFGNTNSVRKNPTGVCAKRMLREISLLNLDYFEVHMIMDWTKEISRRMGEGLFSKGNSFRFENPSIERMIEKICECKYFIGVDSGPLYLAGSILGFDKVIGIQKLLKIDRYLPVSIPVIDVNMYKPMSLYNELRLKEKSNGGF